MSRIAPAPRQGASAAPAAAGLAASSATRRSPAPADPSATGASAARHADPEAVR